MASTDKPTRVLVVDDSALYRQAICNVLRSEPDVEVVGIAKNGVDALEQIGSLDPDVLTLDVQMPDMDGIEVLREMKKRGVRAAAIMVSSYTSEGAQVTTDALLEGAFDFISKPSGGDLEENRRVLHAALSEKLALVRKSGRRLARLRRGAPQPRGRAQSADERTVDAATATPCSVVLIATSTGGPAALKEVLPALPADFGVPILIVQHMPARYTKALAARLDQICELTVSEASDGMRLAPGHALLAPGGRQLGLRRRGGIVSARITDDPPENGCVPSADYMFRAATETFDGAALAVVMTGMGRDGMLGCVALKERGGVVLAQDEDSATVYGMPKAIASEGLADRILPLERIGHAIDRHVTANRT